MPDHAGRNRRRRMLLLFRQPAGATPQRSAGSRPVQPALCCDEDYVTELGSVATPALSVENLARRVLREQPLAGPALRLGRGPENDLWLNHERIQPRHLVLLRLPGGVFYVVTSPDAEVLGPKGPVDAGWWTPGLCLRTGAFRLRMNGLRKTIPDYDPLAVSPALTCELPHMELKFLGGAEPNRPWRVTRPLTLIGNSPICRIRLDHDRILPVQAALVRHGGRLWLINFGPADQLRINKQPAVSASLDIGDVVRVGDFRLEVQAAAEWPMPAEMAGETNLKPAEPTGVDLPGLLQQFADQHQKILATQQTALNELSQIASAASDPAQLKAVLQKIQQSYAELGRGQTQIQAKLQAQLKPPAE